MEQIQHYLAGVQQTLDLLPQDSIRAAIETLHAARLAKRTVFIMGNGGSASTASHFVCDLAKNTRAPGQPDFRVLGLADNMAIFSAYGNDEGYHNVFARQLATFVEAGDVVIAISTSGNSPNVLRLLAWPVKQVPTSSGSRASMAGHWLRWWIWSYTCPAAASSRWKTSISYLNI
jgi:D-sedoheptulose 7-phosphate isomerase